MRQVRAFLAIPLPEEVLLRARQIQKALAAPLPGVRWVRSEAMHLTLRFFGEVSEETLDRVGEVMLSVGRLCSPFRVEVIGAGAFPSPARPRVFWLGFGGEEPLLALHAALEEQLAGIGIPAEKRPFSPHLTLGRARYRLPPAQAALEPYQNLHCGTVPVDRIVLYESRLQPTGAVYLPLKTAVLG